MTIRSIKLSKVDEDTLRKLCAQGRPKLASMIEALDGKEGFVKPSKFRQALIDVLSDKDLARDVDRLLMSFEARRRQNFLSSSDFVEGVDLGLNWDEADRRNWTECKRDLESLLVAKSVVLAAKATELSYDFDQIYATSRIVTDIRPIFDEARAQVIAATITQTLRLQTYSVEAYRDFSFAMNIEDIRHLRETCDAALRKADLARKLVEEKCQIDAVIPRDEANGDS